MPTFFYDVKMLKIFFTKLLFFKRRIVYDVVKIEELPIFYTRSSIMKQSHYSIFSHFLILVALFTNFSTVAANARLVQDPLLVVLIMVKDEKEVIIPTLETYLTKATLQGNDTGEVAFVLYDTGSTDGTEILAEEFFKKHGIKNYSIKKDGWFGFGRTRNKALAFTRATYPKSSFIAFVDAEWYLRGIDQLLEFCRTEEAKADNTGTKLSPFYSIWMKRPGSEFGQQRLFATHDDVEFDKRRVHECPNKYSNGQVPRHVYFDLGCSKSGYLKSRARWFRDRDDMLLDLLEDPKDPRTVYYLGLTELWLENYRNAYSYFKMRTGLSSFAEEDFMAHYYLGRATEALCETEPASFKWEEALGHYLKAFTMRPHRAEPLVKIARHYLNENNHALSYMYARRACELPLPTGDKLPYEKYLYDFDRYEILSRCAWYVQEYEVGEDACKKAIEARPNQCNLYKNLSFYWERKK